MPVIALLRHGQASFGTENYDRLSDLGRRQAEEAGRALAVRGLRSPLVVSGSLARQRETARIAAEVLGVDSTTVDRRFDEFDAHGAVEARIGRPGATLGMDSREFQEHLDAVMVEWMENGDVGWQAFADGAVAAVRDLAQRLSPGRDAVVATSGGVTAAITGALLGCDPQGVVRLSRVSVNASITTIVVGTQGLSLVSFNDHAHLLHDRLLRTSR